jgi:hypothetical protein
MTEEVTTDRDRTAPDQMTTGTAGTPSQNDQPDRDTLDGTKPTGDQPTVQAVLNECQHLRETVTQQQDIIDAQQDRIEDQQQTIKDQVARITDLENRVAELEADSEKTRDIARSAIAKAEQATTDTDQENDTDTLPEGIDRASSPLDFFANCRQSKVKEVFVEQSNRANTHRAICIAKRWPEFAQERADGSGVFFTKDHIETALTAHLDSVPHRQTIARVWDRLQDLGGDDLRVKRRRVSSKQEPTEILAMDIETAEGLLDGRYLGLDLLDATDEKAQTGGVTPVVTGAPG